MASISAQRKPDNSPKATANHSGGRNGMAMPAVPVLQQQQPAVQREKNNTGLPDNLKSGIETLSGFSMSDVKVHYNSAKPAQLQAFAYAQGTDIHIGPGQEKHLPHEAWHVAQQKQGRVQTTIQAKGTAVNDDKGLETEADVMGTRAAQMINVAQRYNNSTTSSAPLKNVAALKSKDAIVQKYAITSSGQVSEDNSIILRNKTLFATSEKIIDSNNQLALAGPHGSMIKLNKTGDGKGPDKKFFNILPGINISAYHERIKSMSTSFHKGINKQKEDKPLEIWADCRRASELVTGASSGVSLMDRKVKIGNDLSEGYSGKLEGIGNGNDSNTARLSMQVYATHIRPFLEKHGLKESLSLTKLKKSFNDDAITFKFIGEVLPYAKDNLLISKNLYASLKPGAKDDFHKETATNEYANPEIGDAYGTVTEFGIPGFKESGDDWAFHWGGVVMKGGSDNVTLENLSVSDESVKNSNWFFSMYGTANKEQSFHARQMGTGHHGSIATTITAVTVGSTENRKLQALKDEISKLKKLEALNGADERESLLKTAIEYNKLANSLDKPMLTEYEIFSNTERGFTSESTGKVHTLNKRYIPK